MSAPKKRLNLEGSNRLSLRQRAARLILQAAALLALLFLVPHEDKPTLPMAHVEISPLSEGGANGLSAAEQKTWDAWELERVDASQKLVPSEVAQQRSLLLHTISDLEQRIDQHQQTPGFDLGGYQKRLQISKEAYQALKPRTE